MPAAIEVTGIPRKPNIYSYNVQEDAIRLDPNSFEGGVGQLALSTNNWADSFKLLNSNIDLSDGIRGKFQGIVRDTDATDGVINITADGALALFNSWRTVAPFNGTLNDYMTYMVGLVGITNNLVVDSSIASTAVVVPGFLGNVWDNLKQFFSVNQWEIALVFNRVIVRPIRTIVAQHDNVITETQTRNNQVTAEQIEIYWYNHTWGTQSQVYPIPSSGNGVSNPIVVNAGETIVQQFTIDGSLATVNQPVVQDFVANASYAGTNGVYAVAGNDGLPVTAAQWSAQGGRLSVRITSDPSIIEVMVTGASSAALSPYRIAMTAGTSSYYDSLRITGTGITWDKQLLTLHTGAAPSATGEVVGATVDNRYVRTLANAYTSGIHTAAAFSGPTITLSGSVGALNRSVDDDAYVTSTIGDFNTYHVGDTIGQFNTEYSGWTIQQFNDFWRERTTDNFVNQLFGQGIGSRILTKDINYRVVSTTTDPARVQYTAVTDTTIGDFNSARSGKTIGQFNAQFAGYRIQDFNAVPLRTS